MSYITIIYQKGNDIRKMSEGEENFAAIIAILLFALVVLSPIIFIVKTRTNRAWKAGFKATSKFTRDNLMDAYICLSANMILKDRVDSGKKVMYMKNYFQQKFPESIYDFSESLTYAYQHPTDIRIITAWMNQYMPKKEDRVQILYFLAGISMVDGLMINHEYNLLNNLRSLLKLEQSELDSILAMYTKHKESQTKSTISSTPNQTKIEINKQILGLKPNATFEEVKKAYRNLVMINHPDKFESAGKEQMNLAKERFLKIQEAYEFLEKMI